MLKLAALGALGYAGYKYYQKNGNPFNQQDRYDGIHRNAAAGGRISDDAVIRTNPNTPPV